MPNRGRQNGANTSHNKALRRTLALLPRQYSEAPLQFDQCATLLRSSLEKTPTGKVGNVVVSRIADEMPCTEAPSALSESSPESSLSPERIQTLPAAVGPQIRGRTLPPPFRLPRSVLPPPPVELIRAPAPLRRSQLTTRRSSFDRDIPTVEEDNYWPGRPYLLPVVLPPVTEPTLDELLRRVTERSDLQNVETVRLRVISYSVSLSRLSAFMPRLQQLDLSGSVLSSLRDLGCGLVQLTQLNVSNCGLNSFDGTSGLPALRVLIADNNMIQRVGPLSELSFLQRLSAQHNRISELGLLTFLGMCPNLVEVELQGNPVCHLMLYRVTLRRSVPTLQLLDGVPFAPAHAAAVSGATQPDLVQSLSTSTDGELSSLSSAGACTESASSLDSLEVPAVAPHRPATAPSGVTAATTADGRTLLHIRQQPPRPSSAVLENGAYSRRDSLSLGAPIAGSVLGWARRRRRRNAWDSNSVSSGSSASASSSNASTRPPSVSSGDSFE